MEKLIEKFNDLFKIIWARNQSYKIYGKDVAETMSEEARKLAINFHEWRMKYFMWSDGVSEENTTDEEIFDKFINEEYARD